jgi:hypothetical protein
MTLKKITFNKPNQIFDAITGGLRQKRGVLRLRLFWFHPRPRGQARNISNPSPVLQIFPHYQKAIPGPQLQPQN